MRLQIDTLTWPLREPFAISRGIEYEADTILVTMQDEDGHQGRGEGCGVAYHGETPATMTAQIETVRPTLEQGVSRQELLELLPPGGARCAVDTALWDLEAKREGRPASDIAGLGPLKALTTAYTIGIRAIEEYEVTARSRADYPVLKIKVDSTDPIRALEAVRRGAPSPKLIVDPNQAWSVAFLKEMAPHLAKLGVVLLEQPIKVGEEHLLDGYRCPIPLCADEAVDDVSDLAKVSGRFSVINIKLDKAGGLTNALMLGHAARAAGFDLMVGCMTGTSLSMAPGIVLGQLCEFVDLDGPLLLAKDWPNGLTYRKGIVAPAERVFWG
jgi:L-Ala-D/L-Glu epimerase